MNESDDRAVVKTESELYEVMYLIRQVETTLLALFSDGTIRGTTHTCLGQEACAAGVALALDRDKDIVVSNHRSHGHYLAHTGDVEGLICELMGKQGGPSGGIGGSQHLFRGNFYSNGILGGTAALATGIAMAEKLKRSGAIITVFLGDGAMGEGIVYEAANAVSLWSLPVLFAIEKNQFAQSTPIHQEVAGRISDRLTAFGIETVEISDSDPLALHRLAGRCVNEVRSTRRPRAIVMETYRLGPHSKGDDDRNPDELAAHWERDPLKHIAAQLPHAERSNMEATVAERVSTAVGVATEAPEMEWDDFYRRMVWS
jgi:TPP-dependent pyruvate/acetoin dehydrogenase alpha subunit